MQRSYADHGHEPKPIIGPLAKLYETIGPLHWPLIRATVGIILFTHGWPKLMVGAQVVATGTLARNGIDPILALAYTLIFLETVGAICITIGLLTRPMAVAIVIEFTVIVIKTLPNGWAWGSRGVEYPLLWGLIFLAIAIRGGGPYSVDRVLGREL